MEKREKLFHFILPIAFVILGIVIASLWMMIPDEAKQRPPSAPLPTWVEISKLEEQTHTPWVEAMGQVMPAMQVVLKPEVSGRIESVSSQFTPGGQFKEDSLMLNINADDYRLAVKREEASLEDAKASLALEMGRVKIAKEEIKLLNETLDSSLENPSLALRAPQRRQAELAVEKARIALETARLNLSKTEIYAPFNGLITARHATLGDTLSTGTDLATFVGTDAYWIELALPLADIDRIFIPTLANPKASEVKIISQEDGSLRTGFILKMTGEVDATSRLAKVLVQVNDPLNLEGKANTKPLILRDYVKVLIEGKPIENAIKLPYAWVRDGGKIWIFNSEKLTIRSIIPAYKDRENIYITAGASEGEYIVTSNIPAAVEGMALETMGEIVERPSPVKMEVITLE